MNRKLIIYDNEGTIFLEANGDFLVPNGLQHLIFDVPEGKVFVGINLEVTPHEPIFEDIPPSEIDVVKQKNERLEEDVASVNRAVLDILEMMILGGI